MARPPLPANWRRRIATAVLVVATAAIALVLLRTPRHSADVAPAARAPQDVAGGAAEFVAPLRGPELEAVGGSGERTAPPIASPIAAESERTGPGESSREVVVVVVDGPGGPPVPGVEIAFMERRFDWASMSNDERHFVQRTVYEPVRTYRFFGDTRLSDDEGRLRFRLDQVLALASDDGTRRGELFLSAATIDWNATHELVLRADSRVRLRVVDANGAVLPEFPVRLLPNPLDEARAGAWGSSYLTGEDGLVTLPDLAAWASMFDGTVEEVRIELDLVGLAAPPSVTFQLSALPADVLELEAPPTGEVVVRVHDPEGRPTGAYDDIALRLAGSERSIPGQAPIPGEEGGARYRYVTLGLQLVADASVSGEVTPRPLVGPAAANETVEVELRSRYQGVVIAGRLVDKGGGSLGAMMFRLHVTEDGSTWSAQQLSDGDGTFRVELGGDLAGKRLEAAVIQRVERFERTGLGAELPVVVPLHEGLNDFGDVMLEEFPLLVAGEVRVDGGRARAELSIERLPSGGPPDAWTQLDECAVEWREDETFVCRGLTKQGRLRLVADLDAALPSAPVEFLPGSRGLVLELRRGRAVRAEVLLDDPSLARYLVLELVPEASTPAQERALTWRARSTFGARTDAAAEAAPAFTWAGLEPGTYRLEANGTGAPEPLALVGGVELSEGARADPTVVVIDLRGSLGKVVLHVTDASGEAYPDDGPAVLVWSTGSGRRFATRVKRGRATIVGPLPMALSVGGSGLRTERLSGVREDRVVAVRALIGARFALPEIKLPPGWRAWLRLTTSGDALPEQRFVVRGVQRAASAFLGVTQAEALGPARIVQVPAAPGTIVTLEAWATRGDGRRTIELQTPQLVATGADGEPVAVRIPDRALRAAVEDSAR